MTFKNSAALQSSIFEIFQKYAAPLDGISGILAPMTFQPITKGMASHFTDNGGNVLGIEESDCPLTRKLWSHFNRPDSSNTFVLVMNLAFMWSDAADDATIHAATTAIIRESVAASKEAGLDHPFVYQNYASADQNVFAGYGTANWRFLKSVVQEYDPEHVFQKLKVGYFKVGTGTV